MKIDDTAELTNFLIRDQIAKPGEPIEITILSGGVSSDIWRVDLPGRTFCVKRALPKLRVRAEWFAPVERNNYEWEWFSFVGQNFPGVVPRPIAHNRELGMLAMEFLPPEQYINWKSELLRGVVDAVFASQVGEIIGRIHAISAGNPEIRRQFATDELFFALRIEPYLLATAEKHPVHAELIKNLARTTMKEKIALVHGDVSPKNIMKGPNGPVFLDAETAWYGDPAFDAAFCLNHFLLKAVLRPDKAEGFLKCFSAFCNAYLKEVTWESADQIESRIVRLLPILFLARVDGKSPVEYLTEDKQKETVRQIARRLISRTDQLRVCPDPTKLFLLNWTVLWKEISNQTF